MSLSQDKLDIPDEAERFIRSEFVTIKPGGKSKVLPGRNLPKVEEFYCPACGIDNLPPDHGECAKCRQCNLSWVAYGNFLYLWKV